MNDKNNPLVEDTGGSCNYYKTIVLYPIDESKDPYEVECGDVIDALEMTPAEANIFKEVWRMAAARKGAVKKGNSVIRGAEKIIWMGKRILSVELRKRKNNE